MRLFSLCLFSGSQAEMKEVEKLGELQEAKSDVDGESVGCTSVIPQTINSQKQKRASTSTPEVCQTSSNPPKRRKTQTSQSSNSEVCILVTSLVPRPSRGGREGLVRTVRS